MERECPACGVTSERSACGVDGTPTLPKGTLLRSDDPAMGRLVGGRYRLLGLLGAGGMGTVWFAEHVRLRQPVALKLMKEHVGREPNQRARFEREALAVSRLQHPHVVRVHDFGHEADLGLYLAMEYLEGADLKAAIRQDAPLPIDRIVHILRQVAAALVAAHGEGLVHRDLKPANIFLASGAGAVDFVKVLDFGIAKRFEGEVSEDSLTDTGLIVGSPHYMAPEQAAHGAIGPWTDLYGLGVVLYECLSGRRPFSGEQAVHIIVQHLRSPPPPIERADVPPRLDDLLGRLLAKDPAARPAGAEAVITALDALALDRGDGAGAGFDRSAVTTRPVAAYDDFAIAAGAAPAVEPPQETSEASGTAAVLATAGMRPEPGTLPEAAGVEEGDSGTFGGTEALPSEHGRRRLGLAVAMLVAAVTGAVLVALFFGEVGERRGSETALAAPASQPEEAPPAGAPSGGLAEGVPAAPAPRPRAGSREVAEPGNAARKDPATAPSSTAGGEAAADGGRDGVKVANTAPSARIDGPDPAKVVEESAEVAGEPRASAGRQRLIVESRPTGARVFARRKGTRDWELLGTAPAREHFAEGTYEVRATHPGYRPRMRTVRLSGPRRVTIRLQADSPTPAVEAPPAAPPRSPRLPD